MTFPPRATEFDPARDENIYFFTMVKGPTSIEKREIEFRADVAGPRGQRWEYSRTGQTDQMTRFPERVSYRYAWRFRTRDMAGSPGVWTLFLSIDGESVGSYTFLLGDPATIAKIKEGLKQSIDVAKALMAPSQGRLDLSGPAGAKVQVLQQGAAVTTSALDPSGKLTLPLAVGVYDVEVTQPGFQPWRESITLSEQEQQISRTVTLLPR